MYKGLYKDCFWGKIFPMKNTDDEYNNPRYVPLGRVLFDAREQKGWSRSQVAEKTGVNANTLAKFEKAGTDEKDARWPNANDLAKLCITLDINAQQALLGSLHENEYTNYGEEGSYYQALSKNHPKIMWIAGQLETALKDALLLRSFIKHLFSYIDVSDLPDDLKWLYNEGKETLFRLDDYEVRMLQLGVFGFSLEYLYLPNPHLDHPSIRNVFDLAKKGVIGKDAKAKMPHTIIRRSLTTYAKLFTRLAVEFEALENPEQWQIDLLTEIADFEESYAKEMRQKTWKHFQYLYSEHQKVPLSHISLRDIIMNASSFAVYPENGKVNPEEDLPSPPGSNPNHSTTGKKENDDGQSSS